MKLVFEKNNLVKAVDIVQKAVTVRTTMNILECILIDAESNCIKLTGNDLDLGIETTLEGEIIEKGSVAIDAKIIFDLVKKLPDMPITIEADDKNIVTVTCEKKNYRLNGLPAEEFSYLTEVEKNVSITVSQLELKDIIKQTKFSLSPNDNNPIMTGELFEVKNNNLKVVALDSHRIAIRNLNVDYDGNIYVIIPGKSLTEIERILEADNDKKVTIYFSDNHAMFEFNSTRVVSRLIQGDYFNINKMISNDYETKLEVNRKDLIDAIDTEMIFIKESDKRPVILNITDNNILLSVKSTLGEGKEEVEVEKEGKDIKIGFNPKFLLDALKVIDDETVTLTFVNAMSPCFIRDGEGSYIYLILPVNFVED